MRASIVHADDDLLLERWAAAEKFAFFNEVFGCEVSLRVVRHG